MWDIPASHNIETAVACMRSEGAKVQPSRWLNTVLSCMLSEAFSGLCFACVFDITSYHYCISISYVLSFENQHTYHFLKVCFPTLPWQAVV